MSASHQPTMLTMKDITTTSLLSVTLALVTSTASSACVNPGSIGSMEECVRFCQVDEISYGGGICQCLGKSPGGLWSPFGECTCPGGVDCLPERSDEPPQSTTTSTASPQTDRGSILSSHIMFCFNTLVIYLIS